LSLERKRNSAIEGGWARYRRGGATRSSAAFRRKNKEKDKKERDDKRESKKLLKQKEIAKRLREREKTCGERKKQSYSRATYKR